MSGEVERCTKALVRAILKSDEYASYIRCRKQLDEDPALKQRIKDYMSKNFALQVSDMPDLYDEIDHLKEEYESLRRNTFANEYLEAEASFVTMLREIGYEITEPLDLDLPDSAKI